MIVFYSLVSMRTLLCKSSQVCAGLDRASECVPDCSLSLVSVEETGGGE